MKYKIFLLIFFLSLISSIVLTANSSAFCDPGDSCDVVNSSVYGSTLGIKNSVYGIFIFTFMIALTLLHVNNPKSHTRKIIHAAVIIGSLIAIYFLYLQFFVIRAFCKFCLVVDFGLLIALGLLFYFWEH